MLVTDSAFPNGNAPDSQLCTIMAGGFSATADAFLIEGADGMPHSGGYQRCIIPPETIGAWTTKTARLSATGGWHAMIYTRTAQFAFEREQSLLLARAEREAQERLDRGLATDIFRCSIANRVFGLLWLRTSGGSAAGPSPNRSAKRSTRSSRWASASPSPRPTPTPNASWSAGRRANWSRSRKCAIRYSTHRPLRWARSCSRPARSIRRRPRRRPGARASGRAPRSPTRSGRNRMLAPDR